MTTEDKIAFVTEAFNSYVLEHDRRLHHGLMMRHQMVETYEATGKTDDNYRSRWARETAMRVVELLAIAGIEFNEQNPDDAFSMADLGDIISSAEMYLGMLEEE